MLGFLTLLGIVIPHLVSHRIYIAEVRIEFGQCRDQYVRRNIVLSLIESRENRARKLHFVEEDEIQCDHGKSLDDISAVHIYILNASALF